MAYRVSNSHVTDDVTWFRKVKHVSRDPNTLRVQYLENSCYLETILPSLLWGTMVGYPSDSSASCLQFDLLVSLLYDLDLQSAQNHHNRTQRPENPNLDTKIMKPACLYEPRYRLCIFRGTPSLKGPKTLIFWQSRMAPRLTLTSEP